MEPCAWTPAAAIYDLRLAVDVQVESDGKRLLYGVSVPRGPDKSDGIQLWTCATDGTHRRPLTTAGHRDTIGRWSPDGARVAFVSDREGDGGIFLVPSSGGDSVQLAAHSRPVSSLAWSPHGDRLAYTGAFELDRPGQQGGDVQPRATRRLDYKEDGLGYRGDLRFQLFVLDSDSGARQILTRSPVDHHQAMWSPDGMTLAVRVVEHAGMHSCLMLVDAYAGTGRQIQIGESGVVGTYAWSPLGDRLVITGEPTYSGQLDLYLYDLVGDRLNRLTEDLEVAPESGPPVSPPVWVDDRHVVFHAVRAGRSGLYQFDVLARELTLVAEWNARNTGLSVDRRRRWMVMSHSSLDSVGEVLVFDRRSADARVVTDHNSAILAQRRPAQHERLAVRRGDLTIEGWLLMPANFDPARRYPVVLDVHGGPQGHHGYQFYPAQQCLASHGFLVVCANPRGSGSYGRHFTTRVLRDWGGEDYLDLMAVIADVLDRAYADEDRVGILGYSYGGYMVGWTIGQTDRFRAAVCGAPIFDLVAMYGTSDVGPFWGPIQWGGPPHECLDWYRARSPSTFAHRARTPTLILQGEEDERCPVGQAEAMFVALKQAGCQVELVRYPGAAHVGLFTGLAGHRVDYLERVLDWFRQHLGP